MEFEYVKVKKCFWEPLMSNDNVVAVCALLGNKDLLDGEWSTPVVARTLALKKPIYVTCDGVSLNKILSVGINMKGKLCCELSNNNESYKRIYGLYIIPDDVLSQWIKLFE